jgi:hypothetical protein
MLNFLRDKREARLLIAALTCFGLLLVVKIKLPVAVFMKVWPGLIEFLQSKPFEEVVGDTMTGLVSAYIFYLIIDVLPRTRREKNTKDVLAAVLSSVVHSFYEAKFSAHSYPLDKFSPLTLDDISKAKEVVEIGPTPSQLFSLSLASKWNQPKLSNTLQLAVSMGVDHSVSWLNLIDSVARLRGHSDRAESNGTLDQVAGLIEHFGEFEIVEDQESNELIWSRSMRSEMLKFLNLSEAWLKMNSERP